jgi:D-serine deaminase-like pyridoxal phosphate-dependent protein
MPLNLELIETPALILDLNIMDENIKLMSDFMKGRKTKLRPHFKTHKSTTIAHRQIEAGAKGITCAKLSEAEILAVAGIKDILIANQIVDTDKAFRTACLARDGSRITVLADNPANVDLLSRTAVSAGSVIHVLVELDVGMKRCGVRTGEEVLELAKKIIKSKGLVFEGLQAYEGHLGHIADFDARHKGVNEMIAKVAAVKELLERNGIEVKEISGGGTGTYDITGDNTIWTEIQAGSYVFMDTEYNRLKLPFKNALTVLATVIHKRPGVAVTDAGTKVCCSDQGVTLVHGFEDLQVILNEEHGIIKDENDMLCYLQKVRYIPGHCCATVNLHDNYYCIRDGLLSAVWPVSARGKSR